MNEVLRSTIVSLLTDWCCATYDPKKAPKEARLESSNEGARQSGIAAVGVKTISLKSFVVIVVVC